MAEENRETFRHALKIGQRLVTVLIMIQEVMKTTEKARGKGSAIRGMKKQQEQSGCPRDNCVFWNVWGERDSQCPETGQKKKKKILGEILI